MRENKELVQILDGYKVADLKELAKGLKIKGYSKCKKAELVELILSSLENIDMEAVEVPEEILAAYKATSENTFKNLVADESTSKENLTNVSKETNQKKEAKPILQQTVSQPTLQPASQKIASKKPILGVAPHVMNVIPEGMDHTPYIPVNTSQKSSISSKVYPNDPCPCGSGLKYKKCCGKRA